MNLENDAKTAELLEAIKKLVDLLRTTLNKPFDSQEAAEHTKALKLNLKNPTFTQAALKAIDSYIKQNPEFKAVTAELKAYLLEPTKTDDKNGTYDLLVSKIQDKSKNDLQTIQKLYSPVNKLAGTLPPKSTTPTAKVILALKESLKFTQPNEKVTLSRVDESAGVSKNKEALEQFKEYHAKIAQFKKVVRDNKETLSQCQNSRVSRDAIKAILSVLPSIAYLLGAQKIGNAMLSMLWKPKSQYMVDECTDILKTRSHFSKN